MEKTTKPNKVYEDLKNAILYMRILPGKVLEKMK